MRWKWFAFTLVGLFSLATTASAAETIDLKILYAGNLGSDRAKDFTAFLQKHFAKVTASDFGKFKKEDAKGYDAVIFDWTSIYPRDKSGKISNDTGGISMPPAPRLSQDFSRPAILIGAAGGQVAGTLQLKINWL